MKKILIVVNHLAPYRDDTFKELLNLGDYQIRIMLCEGNKTHPEWKYDEKSFETLDSGKKIISCKLGTLYEGIIDEVKKYKPDVLISSGNLLQVIYVRRKLKRCRIIYMSDQIKLGRRSDRFPYKQVLQHCYSLADGIWTTGAAGEQYFRYFLKEKSNIRQGCYTNDNKRLLNNASRFNRIEIRNKLNIDSDDYVFLFVGKLIKERHIERILGIAEKNININNKVKFLVVGDGPDIALCNNYKNHNLIHINSLPLSELESVYVASDAYLYLGWEPYSLALYESAVLELPIIANREIGAVKDCVIDGKNGYCVDPLNTRDVLHKMNLLINGECKKGAAEMACFIRKERGIEWAARQLQALIEDNL